VDRCPRGAAETLAVRCRRLQAQVHSALSDAQQLHLDSRCSLRRQVITPNKMSISVYLF